MRVTPLVHALRIPFEVPIVPGVKVPRFVYAYLVVGRRIVVIDSGVRGSERAILDYLETLGRTPADISMLILTHSHPDHLGAAQALRNASGLQVLAHPAERAWIEDLQFQERERSVPGFASLACDNVELDHMLDDGDVVDCDDMQLRVLHTPGHSPGSISLYMEKEGVLWTGDAIPQPGGMPIYDDAVASVRSLMRLRTLAGVDVLLQSWDEPIRGEAVRQTIDDGLAYVRRVHDVTLRLAATEGSADLPGLCSKVVAELGLPPFAPNLLVARTLAAHLRADDQRELQA